ncbi:MAG: stage II sporulation protein M [Sphingomonas sp.]
MRALWRETLVAVLITIVGGVAAYLLVRGDPSWFYAIVPDDLAQGRGPGASAPELRAAIEGTGADIGFATQLFIHNSQVALMCFALGFAFGVPTVLMLLYNGCTLGGFIAVYAAKGMGWEFVAWVSIHGTTELFAIALAGAAGLRIGMATAFPGDRTRFASAVRAGRTAALVMLGAVFMLGLAGLIEGIGRQLVQHAPLRAAIGGGALLAWLVYFYAPRAPAEADDHG